MKEKQLHEENNVAAQKRLRRIELEVKVNGKWMQR